MQVRALGPRHHHVLCQLHHFWNKSRKSQREKQPLPPPSPITHGETAGLRVFWVGSRWWGLSFFFFFEEGGRGNGFVVVGFFFFLGSFMWVFFLVCFFFFSLCGVEQVGGIWGLLLFFFLSRVVFLFFSVFKRWGFIDNLLFRLMEFSVWVCLWRWKFLKMQDSATFIQRYTRTKFNFECTEL